MKKKLHSWIYSLIIINLLNSAVSLSQKVEPKFNSALTEKWNNGVWEYSLYETNTYDDSGYLTNSLTERWKDALWVKLTQVNYNNNPNGTVQQLTFQLWNNKWSNSEKTIYTYTKSNKELSITNYRVGYFSNWIPFSRITNTYDNNNYLIKSVGEGDWQIIYENNTDGTVKIATRQHWLNPNWVNYEKKIYEYLPNKKVKTATYQTLVAGEWVNSQLVKNTYDRNGNLTNTLSQQWNVSKNSWTNKSQNLYTDYSNEDGFPKYITEQIWIADISGSKWENSSRNTFYYGTLGTNVFESEKIYTIYPNPAHDHINISNNNHIQGSNYSIIDQTGRKCISGALNNNKTTIDLYNLNAGIYFVQLGQNRNETFKIIKE